MYEQSTDPYVSVWGENLHFGYWDGEQDQATVAEATEALTDKTLALLDAARDERVLDVGCGVGAPALRLAGQTGARVTGISISQAQIASATAAAQKAGLHERVSFQHADAMDLPFPDAKFDSVLALESLHHMPNRRHVLGELHRVLRPGGRVAIADFVLLGQTTPEGTRILEDFRRTGGVLSLGLVEEYQAEIVDAGFTLEQTLDVSAQTRRSFAATADAFEAARDRVVPFMGAEGLTAMVQTCRQLAELPQAGYALFSAGRV
uniref:LooM n=1 Tax=Nocardiopsis flavescens TaxID=758803 RepID=A0A6M5K864_9ACTN|nr:LooM [Nocardiopsis flavescens]